MLALEVKLTCPVGVAGEPLSETVAVQIVLVLIGGLLESQVSDVEVESTSVTVVDPALTLWAESPAKLALMV